MSKCILYSVYHLGHFHTKTLSPKLKQKLVLQVQGRQPINTFIYLFCKNLLIKRIHRRQPNSTHRYIHAVFCPVLGQHLLPLGSKILHVASYKQVVVFITIFRHCCKPRRDEIGLTSSVLVYYAQHQHHTSYMTAKHFGSHANRRHTSHLPADQASLISEQGLKVRRLSNICWKKNIPASSPLPEQQLIRRCRRHASKCKLLFFIDTLYTSSFPIPINA